MSFDDCWLKILQNEGQTFKTITGLDFTYTMDKETLVPSRTDYNIPKSEIQKAFDLLPLKCPGEINDIVRGPAYVWAILNDQRIMS